MKIRTIFLTILSLSILSISSAQSIYAASIKTGDRVSIPKDQIISESLYTSGQTIDVDGTVQGDLICAAQNVRITGIIDGDVICAAQNITVQGQVTGDIRVAVQTLKLEGTVNKNANLFGQQIEISSGSAILGEANIWSQYIQMRGNIAKKFSGGAQAITINGVVDSVDVYTDDLTVGTDAQIKNNLVYTSDKKLNIPNETIVGGKITQKELTQEEREQKQSRRDTDDGIGVGSIFSLLTQLIVAGLIMYFFAKRIRDAAARMYKHVAPSFGIGFLVLILTPIVMIIFAITIIGIPLSILLLFVYIFSFFIARILVASIVGKILLEKFWAEKKHSDMWAITVGITALWILFHIPILGGVLSLLTLLWGLGGVYYLIRPGHGKLADKKD